MGGGRGGELRELPWLYVLSDRRSSLLSGLSRRTNVSVEVQMMWMNDVGSGTSLGERAAPKVPKLMAFWRIHNHTQHSASLTTLHLYNHGAGYRRSICDISMDQLLIDCQKKQATGTRKTPTTYAPNQSLYISNLPTSKIQKPDLRTALYALFSTYGPVLDVVALRTEKMRGQAHIVYRDIQAATQAMRALQGFEFFGKELVRSHP